MKKIILTVLTFVLIAPLMSQESMFRKDDKVVNLGIGIGSHFYSGNFFTTKVPPVSASLELGFVDDLLDVENLTLGLGGYLGFATYNEEYISPVVGAYGYNHTTILVGGRAAVHYPLADNLDTYSGLILGARIVSTEKYGTPSAFQSSRGSGILYNWFFGVRYYFTDNLAVMGELGYGITYLNVGVAIRF